MQNGKIKLKKQQTVVIGVTSGIAGYKIAGLIRILKSKNIGVKVIMTENAMRMFGKEMFEKAAGGEVNTALIKKGFDYRKVLEKSEVEHIKLADSADLLVIAPATANIIGKLAAGLADDLLTTTVMATTAPVVICPSMNVHMWGNPVVQGNINKLASRGYLFMEPDSGRLACGYTGAGRLAAIKKISSEIINLLAGKSRLKGKKVLVTGGGTSEALDAVRYITNKGSGKMGAAIARMCKMAGAEVLFLRSSTSVTAGLNIREIIFENNHDLAGLLEKHVPEFDYLFHSAAVSDYIPEKISGKKIDSRKGLIVKFTRTPKLLHQVKSWNPKIILIGFKAVFGEKEEIRIKKGIEKLEASRSDFIIVNDVGEKGIGFGADDNEVYLISKKGYAGKIEKSSKQIIARKALEWILQT